jgi:uncharacterized membrane protein HdeD (DUF308 family)
MDNQIKEAAWALSVWGAFSVVFGLLIMAWPGITLKSFLIVLGIYLLASGAIMAVGSIINHTGHWIFGTLMGALSVIAGLYVFSASRHQCSCSSFIDSNLGSCCWCFAGCSWFSQ